MSAFKQFICISLLANVIVSGQAISGREYVLFPGSFYGSNTDNLLRILAAADFTDSSLIELFNTTDASELDGWYLETSRGITRLNYSRTLVQGDYIYWYYYTTPDLYAQVSYSGYTLKFRATYTSNPTSSPTTHAPTDATLPPTTSEPTAETNTPTAMPSASPTVFVYLYEKLKLASISLGNAIGIYGQYAIIGNQAYGKLANDAGSAGPGIAYIIDLNTVENINVSFAPSDNEYGDAFGYNVFMHGDYAVISSPYWDLEWPHVMSTIYGHGTVYIFKRTSTSGNHDQWQEMANLYPNPANFPSGVTHYYFGSLVMMKGDYILVGTHRGISAYIFKKDSSDNWNEMATLTPDPGMSDAIWSDTLNEMHLDNTARYVLIGYINDANQQGKVFIFKRNETDETWSKIETLVSPNPGNDYLFGYSVAMYDDYIVIAEPGNDKVHIYTIDKMNINGDEIVLAQTLLVDISSAVAFYGDILCIPITGGNQIWVYQLNLNIINGEFEKVNTLLTSDGGTIGTRTVLQENNLITYTSGIYVYDILMTKNPTTTAAPTDVTSNPTTTAPTNTPTTASPTLHTNSPTFVPSTSPTTANPSYPTITPTTTAPTTTYGALGDVSCNQTVTTNFATGITVYSYYRLVLSEQYNVMFSNCKTTYDTRLSVYNEDMSDEVSYSYCDGDDCGYGLCSTYNNNEIFTVPRMDIGTYYVGVRPYSTSYSGNYILDVICLVPPTIAPPVPDGDIACNQEITYDDTDNTIASTPRYYRFVLHKTADVTFSNCDTEYDTRLSVYDESMIDVSNPYCGGDNCGCGSGINEMFTIPSMTDGVYYIKAEAYSSNTIIQGSYVLEVICGTSTPTTSYPSVTPTTASPTQPTNNPTTNAPTRPTTNPTKVPSLEPTKFIDQGNDASFHYGQISFCIFAAIFVILMH